jgi:hypothetical protein
MYVRNMHLYTQRKKTIPLWVWFTGQVLDLFSRDNQFKSHKTQGYWRFIWSLTLKHVELIKIHISCHTHTKKKKNNHDICPGTFTYLWDHSLYFTRFLFFIKVFDRSWILAEVSYTPFSNAHLSHTQTKKKFFYISARNHWWCSGSSKEKKRKARAKHNLMWICKIQQEACFFLRCT